MTLSPGTTLIKKAYPDPTTRYAQDVAHGRIVAGPYVRDACKRHLRDLEEGGARGLRFDLESADRAIQFFPTVLRLNGGQFEGLPFNLEPSQSFIVGSLFGWLRDDGTRRFRLGYIEQGKGNGKSPLVAGIGLYGLVADGESRAEIFSAASKKDQAMILFRDAVAMVQQAPSLAKRLKTAGRDEKIWSIFDPVSNSFFRPISADDGQSGPRPHVGLIDELHEHKSPTVINMMLAGRKWRRQPLVIAITNSGFDRHSICWEYRSKGIKVVSGAEKDDTYFAYICALDEGEDPFEDEKCWIKANPCLGTIITNEYLREIVNQARGMPSVESTVRRLNFCQWTESNNPAIIWEYWDRATAHYKLEDFRGMSAIGSFDLSATTDLTAFVLAFLKDDKVWLWPTFWIPKEGLAKRVQRDGVPYDAWARDEHILTTPGPSIDKDFVVSDVAKMLGKYDITLTKAPYDRHRIDVLEAACDRVGVKWPLEPFGQGFISMGPAWDTFEVALAESKLRHPDNPVLNWNASNAVIVQDPAGNKKLDKSKATGRIDGIVAATMSVGVLMSEKKPEKKDFQMFFVG
jgi:phage terminase large subunit-like protein